MSQIKITAQLRRFLITGVSATVIDSSVYSLMLFLGMDFSPAKACGFIAAVAFAYQGHRRWTFSTHGSKKRMAGFAGLYATTFVINNVTNTLMLELYGKEEKLDIAVAFVVATGITAIVNFTMMKFFIFRPAKPGAVAAEESDSL
jgi:putative flippase GtrA